MVPTQYPYAIAIGADDYENGYGFDIESRAEFTGLVKQAPSNLDTVEASRYISNIIGHIDEHGERGNAGLLHDLRVMAAKLIDQEKNAGRGTGMIVSVDDGVLMLLER